MGEQLGVGMGGFWGVGFFSDIARKRGLARAHSRQSRPADATVRQTKRSDTLREDSTLPGDGASYPRVASGGPQEVGASGVRDGWGRGGGVGSFVSWMHNAFNTQTFLILREEKGKNASISDGPFVQLTLTVFPMWVM